MKILCIAFDDIDIDGLRPSFSNAQLLSLNGSRPLSSRALFARLYFAEHVAKIQFCDAFCSAVVPNFTRAILFFQERAQVSSSLTMRDTTGNILHFDKNKREINGSGR